MLDLNLELDSAAEGIDSAGVKGESCSTRAVTFHFEILKGVNGEGKVEADAREHGGVRKSRRGPRSKSSQYRGVTFYRRTGRWESHIWDCGKQVYLGGFDTSHAAARAYDRAAVKFRGPDADINFTVRDYEDDIKQLANLSKEEVVQVLRRQSNGLSRVNSRYQGVTLHNFGGLGAQMDLFLGKKACDKEAIRCNGKEATSKFEPHASQMLLGARNIADEKLDLNLRVSLPSRNGQKQKDRCLQLNHGPNDIVSMESHLDAVSCDPPFNFLKRGLDHPITRNDLPSPFFSLKERKLENGPLVLSPQTLSTRTWEVQDQPDGGRTKVDTTQPLFPNVASSGFPLSASATVPHHPSQPFLNLTLPSLYFIHLSDNTPQQYHHHNSQPPP